MAVLRNSLAAISTRARVVIGLASLGVLALAFLMFTILTAPDYSTLASGLDPADTGKITAALDERGIPYELQNNGTAIAVDKASTGTARIALAEQGLPGKGKPGFELFDEQQLGASDFQQQVSYQRALEGEIGRTLEQVEGVSDAQVQLVLPEEQLFEDEQAPATAAVVLSGGTGAVEAPAVRGMAQLVSASVKGLKPANVNITDSTGALLWPVGGDSSNGGGGGGSSSKQGQEARYERALEGRLSAMLASTIGPGRSRVSVKADLDADKSREDRLAYSRRGVPVETTTENERLRGAGAAGGGAAGVAGNIPTYPQAGRGSGNSNYNRQSDKTTRAVGKTVTRTERAPGRINRQDVALVLASSVSPADARELRRAVAAAAGIERGRGDTLAVSQIRFAGAPAEATESPAAGMLSYARYAALALACLLFLVFVGRHLRRREREELPEGQPVWLREIDVPTPIAELEGRGEMLELDAIARPADSNQLQARRKVEDLVNREPERVAQQVRVWLNEEE